MCIKVNLFVENISIHIFVAQIKNNKWGYKIRRVSRVVAIEFCEVPLKAENYAETYNTKSEAFKREQQIKSYKSGEAFKKLIENTESWQSG